MSQWNKILMALFAILISVILGLAYLIYDFDSGDCNNRVVDEFLSPGAIYKAVIFERSCGSSDKKSTQISIVRSFSDLPPEAGNILLSMAKLQWSRRKSTGNQPINFGFITA